MRVRWDLRSGTRTLRWELDTVHWFRDPDYAALTLRLRNAGGRERALVVAGELAEHGHVDRVDHHDAARGRMIDAYFDWHAHGKRVSLVSATNVEADAINDAIQQRRVDQGEIDVRVAAWGMGSSASSTATRDRRPRTDAAARACLAESIQRGTSELTMQDGVRAAQAEMQRAAGIGKRRW